MIDIIPDTVMSSTLECNVIPESAIRALDKLWYKNRKPLQDILTRMFSYDSTGSPWRKWMVEKEGSYSGTWTKRFSKYCYEHHNVKLEPQVLEEIGNVLGKSAEKTTQELFFEFTHFMNWTAGSFGERPDSCWWNSKNSSRIGLSKHPDGFAVLFYKSEEEYKESSKKSGYARCFGINTPKGFVIFNAYGIELPSIAKALSEKWGVHYQKITIYAENSWINKGMMNNDDGNGGGGSEGTGFIIGKDVDDMTAIDIGNITLDEVCRECLGKTCSENSYKVDDFYLCKRCGNKAKENGKLFQCRSCGGWTQSDNHISSKHFCHNCYDKLPSCSIHGKYEGSAISIWHSAKKACPICVEKGVVCTCDGCGHIVESFSTLQLPLKKVHFCRPCIKKAVYHANISTT